MEILASGVRSRPTAVSHLEAENANGDVLLIVDADMELHHEGLNQIPNEF
ncbi:MAG: hypothetical protein ACK5QW_07265 [Cyanobacteriota bacterium]|jgi:hypothetical protein